MYIVISSHISSSLRRNQNLDKCFHEIEYKSLVPYCLYIDDYCTYRLSSSTLLQNLWICHPKDMRYHIGQSAEQFLGDVVWQQQLQCVELRSTPTGRLDHESFGAFEHQLSPPHTPTNGHILGKICYKNIELRYEIFLQLPQTCRVSAAPEWSV